MDNIKRICLWSGPRNISTALMYSFAQRNDTRVFDEPLYAYYLKNHPEAHNYHPGSENILNTMENDGEKVVTMMMNTSEKPVLFFKHMTHHLLGLKRNFMKNTINIILTRHPQEMLPSFDKVINNPTIQDVGYGLHVELVNYFKTHKIPFVVLNSKQVLLDPEQTLLKLCEFIKIPFDESMLSWQPQQRPEDGIWAKYWYHNVHKSSGFLKYQSKDEIFPEHLKPLLAESLPYYKELLKFSI
ncbi:sulfotransferase-like domain-containing protein [Winogradskyella bathintestinalis]|uniref:Sulfotransferase family protein n=1 Tax=Winogradskyella bathintestinalis TaxID=3035208 RepID=A0ABT7ZX44_9FLAO|nr:sulfotransferase family protein [Winogradskyella bathintestinalis]MDN3493313.1 sulfotransferase family protein [Winogradskyella bathintestinalis]